VASLLFFPFLIAAMKIDRIKYNVCELSRGINLAHPFPMINSY
jgi:hypothetical protein